MKKKLQNGFTLIELAIVMGIFATLAAISTIALFNTQHKIASSTFINTFIADIKSQQLRAMVGDSGSTGGATDYGVRIQQGSYILFTTSYGTANSSFNLPQGFIFTNPTTDIIFARGSGEISGVVTIGVKDTSNNTQKTITVNRYGIVTGVN